MVAVKEFLIAFVMMALLVPACAQPSDENASPDQKVATAIKKIRETNKQAGLVILDAYIAGDTGCSGSSEIAIGRLVDGQMRRATVQGHQPGLFGTGYLASAMKFLEVGEYYVLNVACRTGTNGRFALNGPHAKFQVRAGEVVNVGVLWLKYKSDGLFARGGTINRSVGPLTPLLRPAMIERYPTVMKQAIDRPMQVTAPTARVQRGSPLGL
jgi:hypothetical protein